ncbi:hypothetical protein GCM10025862_09880 [Arsenicicoccus piscis]|uniref:Peptidase S9A N-terminal domain-containing protein n=1 Tax=Arsenicicoccus piscis TaxID=673954 RepID=A0ABQ6HLC7_9MICO|nr:hypothetical protein GCM10025862_09880 [Arsenicicoccus piscis]
MSTSSLPTPPRAKRVEHVREFHGDRVVDPYEWLRDKDDPEVIAHLEAENAYTTARTEHLEGLRGAIYDEMVARVQQTDLGVPVQHAGWWYYTRIAEGEQYTRECRVAARPELPHGGRPALEGGQPPEGEQILVDGNVLGAGQEFFALGGSETTHDGTRLAYAVDLAGDERYALTVTDLGSDATRTGPVGDVVDQSVTDIGYGLAFSLDGRFVFYTRWTESWRQHQVWRHEVGRPSDEDVLVHEEPDELYWVGVGSSRDDRWIIIVTASKTTSEVRLLDAADPTGEPRLVAPRREGVEYDVEPAGDRLFIVHNAADVDYELAVAPIDSTDPADWVNVLGPTPGERIVGCDAFDDFAVVSLRSGGLAGLRVIDLTATLPGSPVGRVRELAWHEPLYTLSTGNNPDPASTSVQVVVESFVTPRSVYDVDLSDLATTGVGEWTLLKQQQVLGGVDLTRYVQRREWATAPDGTLVPVSIVHRQGSSRTAPHQACSTATAPTSTAWTRGSRCCGCRCSTAASSTPSPTCAVAARWVAGGTTRASCWPSATPSPTSSPPPTCSSSRAGSHRIALRQKGLRQEVCSWAPSRTSHPTASGRSTPASRSSTRSTPSSDRSCR